MKKEIVLGTVFRILDANINRAKEGLRVCEDIVRFACADKKLSQKYYRLRHDLSGVIRDSKLDRRLCYANRDTAGDVGRHFADVSGRQSTGTIYLANAQRVKEALRVLEEFMKISDWSASANIQGLRFRFYRLEQETVCRYSKNILTATP